MTWPPLLSIFYYREDYITAYTEYSVQLYHPTCIQQIIVLSFQGRIILTLKHSVWYGHISAEINAPVMLVVGVALSNVGRKTVYFATLW